MKLKILTHDNSEAGNIDLPQQFHEEIRPDIITRAVLAIQAANRQPYGPSVEAGKRHSSKLSRRRRDYRGSYGKGISRVPRKIMNRRGMQMSWVGALSPGTVGGRRAHPPKPFSDYTQKLNTAENRKAIRSALSATVDKAIVAKRGHKIPVAFPFVIDTAFENITKTSDLEIALVKLGFANELVRAGVTRIRAGRGKARGRRYKSATSILFVVSKDASPLVKAAGNMPGCDVIAVHRVNAELLAPGAHPGRLTLYTKAAVERLAAEGLFTKSYKGAAGEKKVASKSPAPKKTSHDATGTTHSSSEKKAVPKKTATKPAAKTHHAKKED